MPEKWLPLLKRSRDGGKRKLGERGFALSIEGNLSPMDDWVHALVAGGMMCGTTYRVACELVPARNVPWR